MDSSVVLVDLDGTPKAFLEPDSISVARQWCGGAKVEAVFDVRDPKAALIIPASTALQVWLDDELRFHGQVGEPVASDSQNVSVVAGDPWDAFGGRTLSIAFDSGGTLDAGVVAWTLINSANLTDPTPTGVREGTIVRTVAASIGFPIDTVLSDAISALSQLDGSFGFTLDPVGDTPGIRAEFNTFGASQVDGGPSINRGVLEGVRFEYGDGTLDNCSDFTEELARPRNWVIAQGQALPDGTRPQQSAVDLDSIDEHGLWQYVVSVDTTDDAVLLARAQAELCPAPVATYTMAPTPDAPLLFKDFDVGHIVDLTIRHGRVNVTGSARVDSCTIKRDTSDWYVDSLTLSSPHVQRIAPGSDSRFMGVLKGHANRLALLERARLVGS